MGRPCRAGDVLADVFAQRVDLVVELVLKVEPHGYRIRAQHDRKPDQDDREDGQNSGNAQPGGAGAEQKQRGRHRSKTHPGPKHNCR